MIRAGRVLASVMFALVARSAEAQAMNLGHPSEIHCTGQAPLLASYYDLFDNLFIGRDFAHVDRWVEPDYKIAGLPAASGKARDLLVGFVKGLMAPFPKRHIFNDVILCKDDVVIARQTVVAINDGPFLGKPASGVTTTVNWTDSYRFHKGRLSETLEADGDTLGTLRQIGWKLVPPGAVMPSAEPVAWVDYYPAR